MPSPSLKPIRAFKAPPFESLNLPAPPEGKLDLEIGAGAGLHATRYALQNPDRFLVALERTSERFAKFKRRVAKYGELTNLLALQADAQWWVPRHIQEPRLERVFLFYPNPYPKASQAHLRWPRSPFMGFLLDRLQPYGELLLTTNIQSYFEEAKLYFESYWGLEVQAFPVTFDTTPRTHFEKKYLERRESCFEIRARKPKTWRLPNP